LVAEGRFCNHRRRHRAPDDSPPVRRRSTRAVFGSFRPASFGPLILPYPSA
jgi:hypothetical protein